MAKIALFDIGPQRVNILAGLTCQQGIDANDFMSRIVD